MNRNFKSNKSLKRLAVGLAVCVMIVCIIYFWCRIAASHSESGSDEDTMGMLGIEKVGVPAGIPSVEKDYEGFSVSFNPERHTPNYVSWILHSNETYGHSARSNSFWTDEEVEGCADTRDYVRSGYDRGHMCPAGEQKWSAKAMRHSFVMTNICPQKNELNSGAWKTLEEKERFWAMRDSLLVIVAGPIYNGESSQTIGANRVAVPDAFFKVLLAPYASPMRAIGFVFPNMKCPGNMENYSMTVDEVERITGLDFFPSLPDEIENEVESVASFNMWNPRYIRLLDYDRYKRYEHR